MKHPHRPGFALLLTLMVLALAAVILSLTARRSTTATRDAMQAERDLRHKWALAAGDVLLEQADALLVDQPHATDVPARPVPAKSFSLNMSGERVVILLSNEQAKPNLNTLSARLPAPDFARLVETMGGKDPVATNDPDHPFWCLEQLRTGAKPVDLLGSPWPDRVRLGLASSATLWGDGKLDWRTATPEALTAVLGPEVPPDKAQALASAQQNASETALEAASARWTPKEKQVLQLRTTVKPQVWSAWVAVGPEQTEAAPVCYRLTLRIRQDERVFWKRQEWNPAP